jgi:hypothetical protein
VSAARIRAAARGLLVLSAACASVATSEGCAESVAPQASAAPQASTEPRWQDAFDGTPELLVVVFPRELRKDPLYGSLLRRAVEMARESSNAVAETRTLDAMAAAEEVILGAHPGAGKTGETTVVVLGAPADVDPARLVDPIDDHPLWTAGPPTATERARELVRAAPATPSPNATASSAAPSDAAGAGAAPDDGPMDASLFELPGATWVLASGPSRARMRAAIAHPTSRPSPPLPEGVLAAARLDGPSLVGHLPLLRSDGMLAVLGRRLVSGTLALLPGTERGLRATLTYADEGAARGAEDRARVVVATLARIKLDPERAAKFRPSYWLEPLSAAKISRSGADVVVDISLPDRLIEVLVGLNQL